MKETVKPSAPVNDSNNWANGSFLDSELKENNIFLSSFEDIKSNKCHLKEIDFSSPKW